MEFKIGCVIPEVNLFKMSACNDENNEIGYLEFTPPDSSCNEVNIQNLKVKHKRKGIGTSIISYFKIYVKNNYKDAKIRVHDISPLDEDISVEGLIKFYESNGFKISKNNDVYSGIYFKDI